MHLTQESKHQIMHLTQHIKHLVQKFWGTVFSNFTRTYSKINLIICNIAIIRDPKAIEPKWYLNIHL